jgi:hypothetical protein
MVQATFVVIDHEILCTVDATVPLLRHVFSKKVKATSSGKLLDSMPRNYVVAKMCSCLNSVWLAVMSRSENYQHHNQLDVF